MGLRHFLFPGLFFFLHSVPCFALCNGPLIPDQPPSKLSETGIFEDLKDLKPCSGVVEYDVNSPLWSDGASKRRWIRLPLGGKIQFMPDDPWVFPIGTVLIKHFELRADSQNNIRVETRILILLAEDDWYGYTYRWQDNQEEAVLLDDSLTQEYQVFDPQSSNGKRTQKWTFPSQQACLQCHNPWSGYILGVRTEQLNLQAPGRSANQLDRWNEMDFFSKKIEKASHYSKYHPFSDEKIPLVTRVKSYLATNCAQCHQPGSPVRTNMDLRFKTELAAMNLVGEKPNASDMGVPDANLITPGKRDLSILWLRLKTLTTLRMPPLGSNEPDTRSIEKIGQWIDALGDDLGKKTKSQSD